MKKSLVAAWLFGEAIVIWRLVHRDHHMPVPGELWGITGLFALLGGAAEIFPQAGTVIVMAAWGLDVAGFLNVLPRGLGGQISQAQKEQGGGGATNPLSRAQPQGATHG